MLREEAIGYSSLYVSPAYEAVTSSYFDVLFLNSSATFSVYWSNIISSFSIVVCEEETCLLIAIMVSCVVTIMSLDGQTIILL